MFQPCVDDIFRLLFNQGVDVSEKDILVLTGKKYHFDKLKLREMLESDQRFKQVEEGKWETLSMEELYEDIPLSEITFVITDIETTGPAQGKDKIIDLAAVKFKNREIIDQFESLVNPHRALSSIIVNLTGITKSMVEGAPDIESVLPDFLSFMGGGVFTAHNSDFDYSFINCEALRIGLKTMSGNAEVCTLKVAKKLLPEVKACGLSGLSTHFNYSIEGRHRAMADVIATKFFLDRFLDMLVEQGVDSLFQLLEFQRKPLVRKDFKKLIKRKIRRRRK